MDASERMTGRRLRPRSFSWFGHGAAAIGVVVFSFFAPSSADTMYKCRDSAGRVSYTDQPCANSGTAPLTSPTLPAPPAPDARNGKLPAGPAAASDYQTPRQVEVPPLPEVDVSGLPKDEQGRPILSQTPGASLILEKREPGPVQALARCSSLVTHCVEPGKRDLDACFLSAPRCTTDKPWLESAPCCPPACWERYEKERQSGKTPLAAFDSVMFGNISCVPGLKRTGEF